MRPAEVCGCCTYPSSSSRARMLRMVADETPSPSAVTSSEDATGSPDAMYSRTRAARTRFDRSLGSVAINVGRPFQGRPELDATLKGSRYEKSAAGWHSRRESANRLYTSPRRDLVRGKARGCHDFGAINADRRELVHKHLAVDHGGPDVARGCRIDEGRIGVRPRREVRPIAVDNDQVGAFSRLEGTDVGVEPQRQSAGPRCHVHHIPRRQDTRRVPDSLEHSREPHLLEHVEPVVAGSTVGAERHGDT